MEISKKVISIAVGIALLLAVGRFVYAQVTENVSVTATVVPATLELSGFTFPNSLVTISNFGTPMGTTSSAADGSFSDTFSNITPGNYEVTVVATDQFATDTQPRTFTFTITQNQVVTYSNIILPPTMYATTSTFNQIQTGTITAYGKPNATMYLVVTGTTTQTYNMLTDSTGKATFSVPGSSYSPGSYDIYTYFEVAYPSNTLTITITAGPTATPTPSPTETPIPTSTPVATPTPIEVTGGPGPSATPGVEPTTSTTTGGSITPPSTENKNCPFPFNLLCNADTNGNGVLDRNQEWEAIIRGLAGNALDINGDGITDALDLSIFLSNASIPPSTLDTNHVGAVENDGLCSAPVKPLPNMSLLIFSVFGMVAFMLMARVLIHAFGGASGYSLTQIFAITLILASAFLIYQFQNSIAPGNFLSQLTSTRTIHKDKVGDTITYDVSASSNDRPMNTLDLYLSFNPRALKLTLIDLTESFASIITKVEYSNKCGRIHIIGGVPLPAMTVERELFVRTSFTVKDTEEDMSLVVYPGTRAFEVKATKQSDQFIPGIQILRFKK